jgi:hypothetical protein
MHQRFRGETGQVNCRLIVISSSLNGYGRESEIFQNDLQYSINPRLISRIPSNPNNVSSIFLSFQAEKIISDALSPGLTG